MTLVSEGETIVVDQLNCNVAITQLLIKMLKETPEAFLIRLRSLSVEGEWETVP